MRVESAVNTDRLFGRMLAEATLMMIRQAHRDGLPKTLPICLGGKPSYALPYFGPTAQRRLGAAGVMSYLRPSVMTNVAPMLIWSAPPCWPSNSARRARSRDRAIQGNHELTYIYKWGQAGRQRPVTQAAMSSTDASACRIKANGVLARDSARWTSRRRLRCRTFGLSGPGIEMPRITTPLISARLRRFHQTLPLSNPGRQRHPRLKKTARARHQTKGSLVRPKPTAYGRATLGAKPFRRAPLPTRAWAWLRQMMRKAAGDGWKHRELLEAELCEDGLHYESRPQRGLPSLRPALRGKPNPRPTGVVD